MQFSGRCVRSSYDPPVPCEYPLKEAVSRIGGSGRRPLSAAGQKSDCILHNSEYSMASIASAAAADRLKSSRSLQSLQGLPRNFQPISITPFAV